MEKEQPIDINGIRYTYLKDRLMGGYIYVSPDRSAYLRSNSATEIAGEINITKDLSERGFPVPRILGKGTLPNGNGYYIEESIGDKVFADDFMKETKAMGQVSDSSFDGFVGVIKRYCEAQFNSKNFVPHSREALDRMIGLANVMRNNPPSTEFRDDFIKAYEKGAKRVLSLPWGYVQADLNAFNILPNGIIDFELACFGPVGYDALTNVYFGKMWPKERVAYRFSDEQITRYMNAVDAVAKSRSLPPISEYMEDFLVLKSIWASGKDKESEDNPKSHPEFWAWRINVRDWCIKQYLKGEKIDTDLFEIIGNPL